MTYVFFCRIVVLHPFIDNADQAMEEDTLALQKMGTKSPTTLYSSTESTRGLKIQWKRSLTAQET